MVQDFHLLLVRKHPIDGYNKMQSTDFSSAGTPIMASGDGVIKKADGGEIETV